jgi:hypothetical protein
VLPEFWLVYCSMTLFCARLLIVLLTTWYYSEEMKGEEEGGLCSRNWNTRNSYKRLVRKDITKRHRLEDPGVYASIILKNLSWRTGRRCKLNKLWAVMNTVMNKSVSWNMCNGRFQWPRGPRRRSTVGRLLRSWVRISTGAGMFVCCVCVVWCQVEVSAMGWSLNHRIPTDCDTSLCVIKKPR